MEVCTYDQHIQHRLKSTGEKRAFSINGTINIPKTCLQEENTLTSVEHFSLFIEIDGEIKVRKQRDML